ncbi:MAG: hypothetical protein U5M23_03705 [Marinagarivorans sp.]|nr:hypothetical protein [Marinagarivorans sp.]
MTFTFKQAIAALSLGAMTLTGLAATPAFAQPERDNRERLRIAVMTGRSAVPIARMTVATVRIAGPTKRTMIAQDAVGGSSG